MKIATIGLDPAKSVFKSTARTSSRYSEFSDRLRPFTKLPTSCDFGAGTELLTSPTDRKMTSDPGSSAATGAGKGEGEQANAAAGEQRAGEAAAGQRRPTRGPAAPRMRTALEKHDQQPVAAIHAPSRPAGYYLTAGKGRA